MILFPLVFLILFILLISYKLLGGVIPWLYVIVLGGIGLIPVILFFIAWIRYRMKQ